MTEIESELARWLDDPLQPRPLDESYQQLVNADLIRHVVVQRFRCRGRTVATVVRIGARTLIATADYKLSHGVNDRDSVPEARANRTLDGARHWPGHVFDVDDLDMPGDLLRIRVVCRHTRRDFTAGEILELTRATRPGHPNKPISLCGR